MSEKFRSLIDGAHTRVAEYLLAAHELKDRPPTEDFMLLADPNDLNPTMIIRYQSYLARTRRNGDPAWVLWHALADLPPADFSAHAPEVIRSVIAEAPADRPVHPWVAAALLAEPPVTFADVATRYGKLLVGVGQLWQTELKRAEQAKQPAPPGLPDLAADALRLTLDGPEAPAALLPSEINELMLLPDRDGQNVRNKLIKEIEDFRAAGDAAPPRAMVLEDLKEPLPARVRPRQSHAVGRRRGAPLSARVVRRRPGAVRGARQRTIGIGPCHRRSQQSAHGPRDRQSRVASALRHAAGEHAQRLWSAQQSAHASGVARSSGLELHGARLVAQVAAPADRALGHVSAVEHRTARMPRDRSREREAMAPNPRRLEFESTRDALLAVAGQLSPALGGKPFDNVADPAATCRTLYAKIDRLNLPGVFRTFDFPNPDASSPERSLTTIPQQALFLMNNPLVQSCAKQMLARPDVASLSDEQRVARLFQLAFGRDPSPDESQLSQEMLNDAMSRPTVWEEFAQGLLLGNEFVFID